MASSKAPTKGERSPGFIGFLCASVYETSVLYIRKLGAWDRGYTELPRIPLPRTWVNKGKKKDRSYYDVPVLPSVIRLLGAYDNNYARAPRELRGSSASRRS